MREWEAPYGWHQPIGADYYSTPRGLVEVSERAISIDLSGVTMTTSSMARLLARRLQEAADIHEHLLEEAALEAE